MFGMKHEIGTRGSIPFRRCFPGCGFYFYDHLDSDVGVVAGRWRRFRLVKYLLRALKGIATELRVGEIEACVFSEIRYI